MPAALTPADILAAVTGYIHNVVFAKEGGYTNDPNDSGGETMYGVTVAEARRHGYNGSMKEMPSDLAVSIYLADYWTTPNFASIAPTSLTLALVMFDLGINMGVSRPAKFLQTLLCAFNYDGRKNNPYADPAVDGQIGPGSLAALRAFYSWRGDDGIRLLTQALRGLAGSYYLAIVDGDKTQRVFTYGWLDKRAYPAAPKTGE